MCYSSHLLVLYYISLFVVLCIYYSKNSQFTLIFICAHIFFKISNFYSTINSNTYDNIVIKNAS